MSLSSTLIIIFAFFHTIRGGLGATFTFVNNCDYTVWPGILSNSGSPKLDSTGFQLTKATSRSFQAPTGWSGRFWARTGCNFDRSGSGSCATGDCGSGQIECNGAGADPPATLAEFTLAGAGGQDFYDVSLVDGYNLPMVVEAGGGSGMCAATGCLADLNRRCPAELRVSGGGACKSACEAFGTPEYCCSGEYGNPNTCKPTAYSQLFKSVCPRSYSYAYDDPTSTFTCTGADYRITFCPSIPNSKKASRDSTRGGSTGDDDDEGSSSTGSSSAQSQGAAMLADSSWIAGLATGDASNTLTISTLRSTLAGVTTTLSLLCFLNNL
ncbi:hypothetical protein Syun_005394 [Stephania yunnanensis]|uniref:Thaumatin-like protein n=1 Tax=Stephania yunnanensis TaxID=152371 RepID=A0AAP0L649_9MAGN